MKVNVNLFFLSLILLVTTLVSTTVFAEGTRSLNENGIDQPIIINDWGQNEGFDEMISDLLDRVNAAGKVKVELALFTTPNLIPPIQPSENSGWEADLQRNVEDLLNSLPPGSYDQVEWGDGSPILRMMIDDLALEQILTSPYVISITLMAGTESSTGDIRRGEIPVIAENTSAESIDLVNRFNLNPGNTSTYSCRKSSAQNGEPEITKDGSYTKFNGVSNIIPRQRFKNDGDQIADQINYWKPVDNNLCTYGGKSSQGTASFNPPICPPRYMNVGDTFVATTTASVGIITDSINYTMTVVGTEDVTVPYGTYPTVHVRTITKGNRLGEVKGDTWLADGLGVVRSWDNQGATDDWLCDLTDFQSTPTPTPTLAINDVSKVEGNSGTTAFTFIISLSAASSNPVSVTYTTANGTALVGSDFTAVSSTVTIPAGQTSVQVTINVIGDTNVEPDETFVVNLSAPTNATLADSQGQGTILNDDSAPTPTLTINDVSKAEGNSGTTAFTFTISLSAASSNPVSVTYTTANGTALVGSDFTAVSSTVTIPAGQTSVQVTINVIGDTNVEPDETFLVNLTAPIGATLGDGRGVGTIVNDDTANLPTLKINDVSKAEGNSGNTAYTFTVTLSPASTGTVTVKYATANDSAAAGSDYTAIAPTTLTFNPGETTKTLTVNVLGDTVVEQNEAFFVNLSAPTGATLFDEQGKGTILNDDGPTLKINDVSKAEGNSGNTAYTFTVTLSPASTGTVTVKYTTANDSAAAGSDYTAIALTPLTFNPGETTKTLTVNVLGDTVVEQNEAFFINLSAPTGATLFDSQGKGTILNDDGPILMINDVSKAEGNSGNTAYTFTVTLSPASTGTVTVKYATANNSAVAGSDYTAIAPTTLTFNPGQTTKTLTVNVLGDTVVEQNEAFFVNLSAPTGATLFDGQGKGTILNDDGPTLKINDVSKAEGNSGNTAYTFTVTLNPASTGTVTVKYATANDSARAGSDFTGIAPTTLTFSPGETTKTLTVNVLGDTVVEQNEAFYVNLSAPTGATLFDSQGKGTILNDD